MYTPEEVAAAKEYLLEKIAGGMSVAEAVRTDEDMVLPSERKIWTWLQEGRKDFDEEFFQRYARAYKQRADGIFEEILQIADDGRNDTYVDENGKTRVDWDVVQRSKLRVDARKWILARMDSKRFGDKIETTLQGGDKPIETVNYANLSDAALEEIVKNSNASKT